MIGARAQFLSAGHYSSIAEALVELSKTHAAGARLIMEAGAGTGYYIARVLDGLPTSLGLAIDLSKFAARRAAKAHDRLDAAVADVWEGLPLKDHSIDLALNVFAPRPAHELCRTLHRNGKLIVAIPAYQHLAELRDSLRLLEVDRNKEMRVARALNPFFTCLEHRFCQWTMDLNHQQLGFLVGMGPSARHIDPTALAARIATLPPIVTVTGAVDVRVYEPRKGVSASSS
jgi:23S rRNA (guanine745-N1)-methyltransferase